MNFTNFLHGALLPNMLNVTFGSVLFGFGVNAVRQLERAGTTIPPVPHGTRARAATGDTKALSAVEQHNKANRGRIKRIHRKAVGYIGLATAYLCFLLTALGGIPSDKLSSSLNSLGYSEFALVWIIVAGSCLAYVIGINSIARKHPITLEISRAGYLDAVKAMIAAAGPAVAVVVAAADKGLIAPADAISRNVAVTLLVVSIILSTCDLFWLNLLYDLARASEREVTTNELKLPLVVLWFAGVTFLMGFAYLAKLAYHFSSSSYIDSL
jgi:hypothetical protein